MNRLLVFIVMKQKIHEIFMKKYWELTEQNNEVFFWVGHFELFKSAILIFFFFASSQRKQTALSYEVSFISAVWMVSSSEVICTQL